MMIRKHEPRVPEGRRCHPAEHRPDYDYLLFGKDNFAADRAAAEKLMQSRLDPRRLALANRAFLRRAVRFLPGPGISQFLAGLAPSCLRDLAFREAVLPPWIPLHIAWPADPSRPARRPASFCDLRGRALAEVSIS
jgi:hypothetical protein